jgi:hypothetical protein
MFENMTNGDKKAMPMDNAKTIGNGESGSNSDSHNLGPGGLTILYPKTAPITKSKVGRKNMQMPVKSRIRGLSFLSLDILSNNGSMVILSIQNLVQFP